MAVDGQTEASSKAQMQIRDENIEIIGGTTTFEKDLLSRCTIGKFQNSSQDPLLLNDARRWACNTWKTTSGISVFAMNDGHFLFEIPSKRSSRAGAVRRVGMEEDEIAGEMVEANDVVLASRSSARLVFKSHDVPAGTHLIEVSAIGYFFSPVRVDVSARNPGKVQAALTENRRSLSELVLEPLQDEQYYEIREPFSIMSLVKSPMGLMVVFMLVVMFLMPKLVENMDPEEIRKAQEEMRSQGVPSLSSLLPGAQRSN